MAGINTAGGGIWNYRGVTVADSGRPAELYSDVSWFISVLISQLKAGRVSARCSADGTIRENSAILVLNSHFEVWSGLVGPSSAGQTTAGPNCHS